MSKRVAESYERAKGLRTDSIQNVQIRRKSFQNKFVVKYDKIITNTLFFRCFVFEKYFKYN